MSASIEPPVTSPKKHKSFIIYTLHPKLTSTRNLLLLLLASFLLCTALYFGFRSYNLRKRLEVPQNETYSAELISLDKSHEVNEEAAAETTKDNNIPLTVEMVEEHLTEQPIKTSAVEEHLTDQPIKTTPVEEHQFIKSTTNEEQENTGTDRLVKPTTVVEQSNIQTNQPITTPSPDNDKVYSGKSNEIQRIEGTIFLKSALKDMDCVLGQISPYSVSCCGKMSLAEDGSDEKQGCILLDTYQEIGVDEPSYRLRFIYGGELCIYEEVIGFPERASKCYPLTNKPGVDICASVNMLLLDNDVTDDLGYNTCTFMKFGYGNELEYELLGHAENISCKSEKDLISTMSSNSPNAIIIRLKPNSPIEEVSKEISTPATSIPNKGIKDDVIPETVSSETTINPGGGSGENIVTTEQVSTDDDKIGLNQTVANDSLTEGPSKDTSFNILPGNKRQGSEDFVTNEPSTHEPTSYEPSTNEPSTEPWFLVSLDIPQMNTDSILNGQLSENVNQFDTSNGTREYSYSTPSSENAESSPGVFDIITRIFSYLQQKFTNLMQSRFGF